LASNAITSAAVDDFLKARKIRFHACRLFFGYVRTEQVKFEVSGINQVEVFLKEVSGLLA